MCELLLRAADKVHADPLLDSQLLKRGMVVHIAPDGWGWSKMELTNPEWRILKFPHETMSAASVMLTKQPYYITEIGEKLPLRGHLFARPRAFAFDWQKENLPPALRAYLADDSRRVAWFDVPQELTVAALKVPTTILKNPGEIG